MTLLSTAWAALAALAFAGMVAAALFGLRRNRLRAAFLFLLCVLAFTAGAFGYQRASREAEVARRFHAGIDAQRHGHFDEARQAMRDVLTLDPGNPDARRRLDALSQPARRASRRETRVRLSPNKGKRPAPPYHKPFHKPSPVGITDYHIDVALQPSRHALHARAAFTLKARRRTDRIELALNPDFRVDRLLLNGAPIAHTHTHDLLALSSRLRAGETAAVVVEYTRRAHTPLLLGGDLIDARGVYLRPESRWYPSVGELDFHAPLRISVTVPRGLTAVCAGRLARKRIGPREAIFDWESTEPVQMVCLAAGRYAYGRLAGSEVVETYLHPAHARKARSYQAETQRILRFYAARFGRYPYPKLAIAEIPVFPGGYGSSSLLLLTEQMFAEKQIPVSFLAHEIAHQWWGNLVAPQGLGAGWLSEAFAEYSAVLYQEHAYGPEACRSALKDVSRRYQSSLRPGVEEAIAETDPYAQIGSYEGVIYYKGAYVLHTLRSVVGDDAFRRVLRAFADRYAGRTARIADFEALAAEIHGQPLNWFFDQWLRRPGAPKLKYAVARSGVQATLTVVQEGVPYRGRMDLLVTDASGRKRHTLNLDGAVTHLRIPVRGEIASVDFDPGRAWLQYTPRWVKSL